MTASCADTSTCWGRPDASAVSAAIAASGPTWAQPVGSVHRTGGRSGSPVQYMLPVDAMTPRSPAFQPACGPVQPNGVTETHTACGATAGSTSSAPGHPGVSSTMSASCSSSTSRASAGPSTTIDRSPAFHATKRSETPSDPNGGTVRSGSPPFGSILTTSAPRSAKMRPVMAAGSPARSTTRTPDNSAVCALLTGLGTPADRQRSWRESPRGCPRRRGRGGPNGPLLGGAWADLVVA